MSIRFLSLLGFLPSLVFAAPAQLLQYMVDEPGVEPSLSRYIVTRDFMRMDDGIDDGNFALYDRKQRVIYSVTHDDRTIAEIRWRKVDQQSPMALNTSEKLIPWSEKVPQIGGRAPERRQLFAAKTLCMELVSVPGLMPDAVAALSELRAVLAGEHAAMLAHQPADLQDACDLSLNVFAADWPLRFGLPIEQREFNGRSATLTDFRNSDVDAALFKLPEGYRRFSVSDLK